MSASPLSMRPRDRLSAQVVRVASTPDYGVFVFRNLMILRITGEIDEAFLDAALLSQDRALAFDSEGYGVLVIAEAGVRIPGHGVRAKSAALRQATQHKVRAQAMILGGEGFFASTIRAVFTGILAIAQSRVPTKIVGDGREAAQYLIDHACDPRTTLPDLLEAIAAIRAN